MSERPNILFLMTDQMQGRVLEPDSPCRTPNFDRLAARGVRIGRGYSPNPVCSPARASLMTGLLPHAHGVVQVAHCVDKDQGMLRTEHPHWAQRLSDAGYLTGYFGKWHADHSDDPGRYGWQQAPGEHVTHLPLEERPKDFLLERYVDRPEGYKDYLLYGVTDISPLGRRIGLVTERSQAFLQRAVSGDRPWCCFASCIEPHDPFVCGRKAFEQYDVDSLELPPNFEDDLSDRPALYRRNARVYANLSQREKREAMACYYASITEIDEQYGRLIDFLEQSGQLDNTIVVLTSDHGELLGAHGLYMKNTGAFEEAYEIPMVLAGPRIARGAVTGARVGLHDLCPTLCELAGAEPITNGQSRSIAPLLRDPRAHEGQYTSGYAEYYGSRFWLTQRVLWDGAWKLVFNGFDFDELYNLEDDPYEMCNLAGDERYRDRHLKLMSQLWQVARETGDTPLLGANYPAIRYAEIGPDVAFEN